MITSISVLLRAACPKGTHVGSVKGELHPDGWRRVIYPLQFECGCPARSDDADR